MDIKDTKEETPQEIDIYYKKSPDHRILKIDGAWFAITPQLDIQVALYNDLHPVPSRIRHKVTPEGQLSPEEISSDVESGIDRQVMATLVMNPVVAMQVVNLLNRMIKQAYDLQGKVAEQRKAALENPQNTNVVES